MNGALLKGIIGFIVIVGVGGLVYWQKNKDVAQAVLQEQTVETVPATTTESTFATTTSLAPTTQTSPATTTPTSPTPKPSGITMAQVATHNSPASCWSVINGSVYDLTSWIPNHPGGEKAITQLCGIDGSEKFNRKHGGAAKQATVLAGFKIGTLAQ